MFNLEDKMNQGAWEDYEDVRNKGYSHRISSGTSNNSRGSGVKVLLIIVAIVAIVVGFIVLQLS